MVWLLLFKDFFSILGICHQILMHLNEYKKIFQDDMIDDVASFVAAAEVLKERGAYKIYVMATHCLLSSDAPRLIDNSQIDEVSFHL